MRPSTSTSWPNARLRHRYRRPRLRRPRWRRPEALIRRLPAPLLLALAIAAAALAPAAAAPAAPAAAASAASAPGGYLAAVKQARATCISARPGDSSAALQAAAALREGTGATQLETLADLGSRPPHFAVAARRLLAVEAALGGH